MLKQQAAAKKIIAAKKETAKKTKKTGKKGRKGSKGSCSKKCRKQKKQIKKKAEKAKVEEKKKDTVGGQEMVCVPKSKVTPELSLSKEEMTKMANIGISTAQTGSSSPITAEYLSELSFADSALF